MSPPTIEAPLKRRRGAELRAALLARPQRRLALALAAAATGLALAAAGVFHPAPRDLTSVPPGDVALVNQQPILMSDFVDETQSTAGGSFADATPADRARVLRNMIDQELLVQRALAINLPEQDTSVRDALADGVNNEINSGVLATSPDEGALRVYFAAHQSDYSSKGSMNLTDLVLHVGGFENVDQSVNQALADAAEAVYQLRSGAALDYVQQHFSMMDSGKVSGDTLDFAAQIHLSPKLYAVARGLSDGQVSNPIADTDGVHVLVMHHRVAPVPADFDSVRNNVYSDYTKAREAEAQQENLKFLRATAQILIAPGHGE
jgi:hypothetical protein